MWDSVLLANKEGFLVLIVAEVLLFCALPPLLPCTILVACFKRKAEERSEYVICLGVGRVLCSNHSPWLDLRPNMILVQAPRIFSISTVAETWDKGGWTNLATLKLSTKYDSHRS